MIYLAAPYSNPDPKLVQARMEQIYDVMGEFMKQDRHVLTPLFMHEVAVRHELDGTYDYWEKYCLDILKRCDEMIVLCLPGWTESRGVKGEMEFCRRNGIPITFMEVFDESSLLKPS